MPPSRWRTIAQSASDLTPCNRAHLETVNRLRDGVRDSGGVPLVFPMHPIQESARRPTAALDRNLRLDMQIEVKRLQRQLGLTTILVTHDQDEAMSVADRIAVMNKGRVEQFDSPVAIYDRPRTLFVNGFIGTTNLLNGKVVGRDGGSATIALDAGATLSLPASADFAASQPILLSVRPEQLVLSSVPGPALWPIEPGLSLPLGGQLVHEARTVDGAALKIVEPRLSAPAGAGRLYCGLAADARPSLFPRTPS